MIPWKQYSVSISFRLKTPEDAALYLRLVRNESLYLLNRKYLSSVIYPENTIVDAYGRPVYRDPITEEVLNV